MNPKGDSGRRADRKPGFAHQHGSDGAVSATGPRRNYHRAGHARDGHRRARGSQHRPARWPHSFRYAADSAPRGTEIPESEPESMAGARRPPIMNPWHTLQIALQALRRNKLRSFLTMLGVIIGVFAVIAMVAAGDGATAQVQKPICLYRHQHAGRAARRQQPRRRDRRIRHAANAHLGRPQSHARRSAERSLRRRDSAQVACKYRARTTTGTRASTEPRRIISLFEPGTPRKGSCSQTANWKPRPSAPFLGPPLCRNFMARTQIQSAKRFESTVCRSR